MREAMFYKKIGRNIQCELCPHKCLILEGYSGRCRVRFNDNGKLIARGYGKIVSVAVDPIEKKPLYHFYPGQDILSIGCSSCNMTCGFCQNHTISQTFHDAKEIPISLLVNKVDFGIAFTYNEPFINYEFMYDLSVALKRKDSEKKVVVVTNGMVMTEPLKKLLPFVDAFNLDIKGTEAFYKLCGGHYDQVIENIKWMNQKHLEVTILMVTNHVSVKDVSRIAELISQVNKEIPLHLSRYFPNYKFEETATPIGLMEEAKYVARQFLDYVYLGNVNQNQNTVCPKCGHVFIKRNGFNIEVNQLECQCGRYIRS